MAKPVKHRGKWRIRRIDEHEKRQSAVFDDYKRAQTELSRRQVEVEEIKGGIRNAAPPEKTGDDLFDYWIDKRAPRKRSQKDDESIIRKHLRPAFGAMKLRDIGVEDVDGYVSLLGEERSARSQPLDHVAHLDLPPSAIRALRSFRTSEVGSDSSK